MRPSRPSFFEKINVHSGYHVDFGLGGLTIFKVGSRVHIDFRLFYIQFNVWSKSNLITRSSNY